GIRAEGGNITVRNCYFHDNQDGILTANLRKGSVLIEYSEFARNGRSNGYSHNIYVGEQAKFTLRFCYSHDSKGGQLVKTRAAENYILYNRLTGESGPSNYELDIPNGGLSYVIGNIIQQGPNSTNSNMLAYLLEGKQSFGKDGRLYVINNTFVNDMGRGTFINIGKDADRAVIENNIFDGAGEVCTQPSAGMAHNFVGDPHFVDAAKYDYRLKAGSPAIGAGMIPASVASQSLIPEYEYLHPCRGEQRAARKKIDIGAYAYSGVKGVPARCVQVEK
ncbi:MAG: right-handed parallel beta-helix repeat-containing protein, partial [Acidobacteria bacterium]|nr:right-handed parallel beta-helix repeat-containing protein [Acidobacteriota bacterium]